MKNKYAKLEELYKKIPKIECKGLCHETCAFIAASNIEQKRVKERLHQNIFISIESVYKNPKKFTLKDMKYCKALKDKRCSIYNIRPLICRLYGVAEGLECQFGCKPERIMSDEEAALLINQIDALK